MFNVVCRQSHPAFLFPGTLYARHAQAMWFFFSLFQTKQTNRKTLRYEYKSQSRHPGQPGWTDVLCSWFLKKI